MVTLSTLGFGNPAPIGLLAFGITTFLLSMANAKQYDVGAMNLSIAVFFGGLTQLIAALLAYRRNDTFGLTAFGGYGLLWITLAFTMLGTEHGWWVASSTTAMGWYLFAFGVFGLGVAIASLAHPRFLTVVLTLTFALVFILSAADFTESAGIREFAGWEGVVTGASAVYMAFALLINESFGRTVLPVGRPLVTPAR